MEENGIFEDPFSWKRCHLIKLWMPRFLDIFPNLVQQILWMKRFKFKLDDSEKDLKKPGIVRKSGSASHIHPASCRASES